MDADTRRWLEKVDSKLDEVGEAVARMDGVLSNGIVRKGECEALHSGTADAIKGLRSTVKAIVGVGISVALILIGSIVTMVLRK